LALINIKGFNKNLVFVFQPGKFDDYVEFLNTAFNRNPQIFQGISVSFKGPGLKGLTHEEMAALQMMCLKQGLVLNNVDNKEERTSNTVVYKNIRSGQKVRSDGSIIIWGDVHESAEIIAAQDVIVLGKLKGIAHAGCYGDYRSIVFALYFAPGQIRIADWVSRCPVDYVPKDCPEIAYFDGSNICIEEYSSRNHNIRTHII
jgi:septum site-determining protein MinC